LQRRIAEGGMGQVWRAEDRVLGRPVAVKLLRPEFTEDPEALERFRAEARHAGVLSHPHIAQVYDYAPAREARAAAPEGDGRGPFLVMEYVDGPSLAQLIEREPLPAGFTFDVIAQAAAGLDAAHRAGLVHRDIKPGNLLLSGDGRLKVTDFGIAHLAGSAPITAPGTVMGTALYMAPERITGRPGTPASDLYSLGIVMWECLAGRPPFRGTSADVMAAHLHQALPALPAWVPTPACELIARLTAKDPRYRLGDAGLLAARVRCLELAGAGPRAPGRPWPGGYGVPPVDAPVPPSPVAGCLSAAVPALVPPARPAPGGALRAGPPAAGPGQGRPRARWPRVAVALIAAVVAGIAVGSLVALAAGRLEPPAARPRVMVSSPAS
jgi:eukaryotic-like serine/threonine-protein kinase